MGQPIVHFEIMGQDPEKIQRFYSEMFDWQVRDAGIGGYGLVDREGNTHPEAGGIGGGIGAMPGVESHVTFYVQVPDVEEAFKKAEALGGRRIHGPDEIPGQGIITGLFADPDGNMIGVVADK